MRKSTLICIAGSFAVIFFLTVPAFAGGAMTENMNAVFIMIVAVCGLQISTGLAGMVNLGHAAFMGFGAFSSAAFMSRLGVPFYLAVPCGMAAGAVCSAVFALLALRLRGFYFAITTFILQLAFPVIVVHLPPALCGGSAGIIIQKAGNSGSSASGLLISYYLSFTIALMVLVFFHNLKRTKAGRALIAVGCGESVAEAVGVDSFSYRLKAFVLGGSLAGLAGSLEALRLMYVHVNFFSLETSVWLVAMMILGGAGSVLGTILGPLVLVFALDTITLFGPDLAGFPSFFSGAEKSYALMNIALGLVILLMVMVRPGGLAKMLEDWISKAARATD